MVTKSVVYYIFNFISALAELENRIGKREGKRESTHFFAVEINLNLERSTNCECWTFECFCQRLSSRIKYKSGRINGNMFVKKRTILFFFFFCCCCCCCYIAISLPCCSCVFHWNIYARYTVVGIFECINKIIVPKYG